MEKKFWHNILKKTKRSIILQPEENARILQSGLLGTLDKKFWNNIITQTKGSILLKPEKMDEFYNYSKLKEYQLWIKSSGIIINQTKGEE